MANDYAKALYRFSTESGLVLAAQPEGLDATAFPRLHNTKIYREGAIGLRDKREFFAGVKSVDGIPGWITGIARIDNDILVAFRGTSLYGFARRVPAASGGGFPSRSSFPRTATTVAFENFLPATGVATFATVHPDERANPTMYFTKPGVKRMWKVYRSPDDTFRGGVFPTPGTFGMSESDAAAFAMGSDLPGSPHRGDDPGTPQKPGDGDKRLPQAPLLPLVVAFWGINSPTKRPAASAYNDPAGKLDSGVTGGLTYDWVWCHRNSVTGSLSNPSAGLSATLDVTGSNNAAHLAFPYDTAGDKQIDSIRIFRKGGVLTDYHKVADIDLKTAQFGGTDTNPTIKFNDTKGDNDIKNNELLRLDSFVPFVSTNQKGESVWNAVCSLVFGPYNPGNVILGIGEVNKPGSVFWTNLNRPDTSNGTNNVDVTSSGDPLISGCVFNGIPYVASRGDWYALDPVKPTSGPVQLSFTPRKTKVGRGPIAPWAVAVGDFILFVNTEGLWGTDGQSQAMLISGALTPIFHNEQVGEYLPIKWDSPQEMFRVFWSGPDVHFIYPDTSGTMQHLVYDGTKWLSEDYARGEYSHDKDNPEQPTTVEPWDQPAAYMHTTCVYNDIAWPERNLLLGTDRGAIMLCRPYVSDGWEMSRYVWDGQSTGTIPRRRLGIDPPPTGDEPDAEAQSFYGWVVGHFRTRTDDYGQSSRLKRIGDVSWEASSKWADEAFAGKHKTTMFVTSESASANVGVSAKLTGQVPIGSTIVNADGTGRARYVFPLPDSEDVYSTAWDFLFYGKWNFHNMSTFYTLRTEVIKHYQNSDTNHGIDGWQHVRDGYLDMTLYGPLTVRLEVDGVTNGLVTGLPKTQQITISPIVTRGDGTTEDMTGKRFKYYFSLLPVKGKKFSWFLDCPSGMMIWYEGCEVNGKKWITNTGYHNVNPLAEAKPE